MLLELLNSRKKLDQFGDQDHFQHVYAAKSLVHILFFASSHDGAITFSCGLVPCSNDLRVVLNQTRKVDGDSREDSRIGVLFAGMFVYTYII